MTEFITSTGPNQLDTDKVAAIRGNFNILLISNENLMGGDAPGDVDYTQELRAHATALLAEAIADVNTGEAASFILVEAMQESVVNNMALRWFYNSTDNHCGDFGGKSATDTPARNDDSTVELYAMWSVIRHARYSFPDAKISENLINVTRLRAEALGEEEIVFDLSQMEHSYENLTTDDVEYTAPIAAVSESEPQVVSINQRCEETARLLDEHVALTGELLNILQNHGDISMIEVHGISPEQLYMAIEANLFHSADGLTAAMALQDKLRLEKKCKNSRSLREDLNAKLYLTNAGRNAAMAQHDMVYLAGCGESTMLLRAALRSGMFYTQEAVAETRRYLGLE